MAFRRTLEPAGPCRPPHPRDPRAGDRGRIGGLRPRRAQHRVGGGSPLMTGSPGGPEVRGRQPHSPRSAPWGLAATILALLAVSLWLFIQRPPRARNSAELDVGQIGRLAAAGRFEQALQRVEPAVAADPDNGVL